MDVRNETLPSDTSMGFNHSGTNNDVFAYRFRFENRTAYEINATSSAKYDMDNKGKMVQIFWFGGPDQIHFHLSQANSATPHYDYHLEVTGPAGSVEESSYDRKISTYTSRDHTFTGELPAGDWTFFYMYPGSDAVNLSISFKFQEPSTFIGGSSTPAGTLVDERDFESTTAAYAAFSGLMVKTRCSLEVEHGFFGAFVMIANGFYSYRVISPEGEASERFWELRGPEYWSPGTWTIEIDIYTGFNAAVVLGGVDMRLPAHPDGPAVNEHPAVCAR